MTGANHVLSAELLKQMSTNLRLYAKLVLRIRTKKAKVVALDFNRAQSVVHDQLAAQYRETGRVRAIILKARQEGISTYVAARYFRRLHLFPNQEALVIADEKDRAQTIYSIYDRYHNLLPPEIRPMTRYVSKKTEMVLDNRDDRERVNTPGLGSRISVETANDVNAARGSTVQMVHASELGFWQSAEDVWVSLAQAVPDEESEIIVESTANGVGNFFHQMWQAAEEGTNGFLPIFLPWWIHEEYVVSKARLRKEERRAIVESVDPYEKVAQEEGLEFMGELYKLTPEQLAWRRQTIREKHQNDERGFRQEYPSNAREAFLVSGNCFFDEDVLSKYDDVARRYMRRGNLVRVGKNKGIVLKPAERGYLRIWEQPTKEGLYVIGADTAQGRQVSARDSSFTDPEAEKGGRDFSSADVYDARARRQVAQLHGRMAPEVFAEQLNLLGAYYSVPRMEGSVHRDKALIAVEKNHSSGETVLRILSNRAPHGYAYPKLYHSTRINRRMGERREDFLGWRTTVETRMPMLDELSQAIREESIGIPSADTIKEMRTFVRGEDGKPQAQEGTHDDRVISLAICLQAARKVNLTPPKPKRPAPQDLVGTSPTGLFTY